MSRIQGHGRPLNVKQLRSFLGLVNYYRDFHPQLARVAVPLYRLTKKGVHWNWNEDCGRSFQELCRGLAQNPVTLGLSLPTWKLMHRMVLSTEFWYKRTPLEKLDLSLSFHLHWTSLKGATVLERRRPVQSSGNVIEGLRQVTWNPGTGFG